MSDLKSDFLQGMSYVAATVNIVTTDGPAGRCGVTVSAMSSVSADTEKPTLLVCINDASSGAAPMIENGTFCVNILRDDQSFVSDTFAGRHGDKGEEKFGCAEWTTFQTGAPVLSDALVSFDCKLTNDVVVGSHHVFFGEVQEVRIAEAGLPLIYANRSYGTPFRLPDVALDRSSAQSDKATVRLSCLNSFAPYFLPAMMQYIQQADAELVIEVIEGDQSEVLNALAVQDAELSLVYDRSLPDGLTVTRLAELRPYVLLPLEHPLSEQGTVALEELAAEPLVLLDAPLSRDYFASLFTKAGVEPNIGTRTASFELVRSMVANGAGYSVLVTRPSAMVSYDGKPLAMVQISNDVETIHLALAHRSETRLSDKAKSLLPRIVDYFAASNLTGTVTSTQNFRDAAMG